MTYDPTKVAFIDIETTGLDPERDGIWEIAVIVDGDSIVWQQLLSERQLEHLHPDAARITNFHERYNPADALAPSRSIRRFMQLVGDRHLVGACPWFDSERLHRMILADARGLDRELPWHYHLIDVENLAVGYLRGRDEQHAYTEGMTAEEWLEANDEDPSWNRLPWKSRELAAELGIDQDKLRAEWGNEHTALADAWFAKLMYEAVMGPPEVVYR